MVYAIGRWLLSSLVASLHGKSDVEVGQSICPVYDLNGEVADDGKVATVR